MLTVGVQTWGTGVAALERYWKTADDLGYARITYGDGLGDWTHDGWTMLGALAVLTRRARIGPAVTYAFDASAHHPSWLAKRALAVDHLSGGRLDLRLAVGAEDATAAEGWTAHGIPYPAAGARLDVLEESVGGRCLPGVVPGDDANEEVRVNGSHAASARSAGCPPSAAQASSVSARPSERAPGGDPPTSSDPLGGRR